MTPRISSWPPRQFPFRTRLSTGEVVPIATRLPDNYIFQSRGLLYRKKGEGWAISVDDANKEYYDRVETLIHEFVHLAEEEMVRDGLIKRRMSEKRVEAMGVHLTRYLAEARMLRGLPERVMWDQPMLPFEEEEADV